MSEPADKPTRVFAGFGILFGVGAWIIFLGPEDKFSLWEVLANTLLLISFSILTVVILRFLWAAFGGDPVERSVNELRMSVSLLEDSHETGVRRILTKSGSFGGDITWLEYLLAAKRHGRVDLMGYTLTSWINEGFQDCIVELVARGVVIRTLCMDPENPLFGLRFNENIVQQQPADLAQDCTATIAAFDRIQSLLGEGSANFEYRLLREGSIKISYTRVDNHALAVPYLYSVSATSAPLLEVAGSSSENGLLHSFDREFTALWEKAPSRR